MRFSTFTSVLAVAGSALASPVNNQAQAQALTIHLEDAECNTGKCVEVVAAAGCIALGIAGRSVSAVLACVGGATDKVCGCAGCIDELGSFLEDNGVC